MKESITEIKDIEDKVFIDRITSVPFFSEGLFIVLASALGYMTCYIFELSYCRYFNIPIMFIDVGVSNVLYVTFICSILLFLFFLFIVYPLIELYNTFFSRYKSHILFVFGIAIFLWIFFFFDPKVHGIDLKYFALSLFSLLAIIYFADSCITSKESLKFHSSPIINLCFLIFSIYMFFALFTISIGSRIARTENSYMILPEKPELVVLKHNSDILIAAEFDRNTNTVSTDFQIIHYKGKRLAIKYEKIGRLRPINMEEEAINKNRANPHSILGY